MKKYYECVIEQHHAGFGMYDVVEGDEWYADIRQYESDVLSNVEAYRLGRDELPDDCDDIRGRIYNEPEFVWAVKDEDSHGTYYRYVALQEVEGIDENVLQKMIEHLEEMKHVVVSDLDSEELKLYQEALAKQGYETEFKSTDKDYLILIEA